MPSPPAPAYLRRRTPPATPAGLPVTFALAGAKADERDVCAAMIDRAGLDRPGQTIESINRPPKGQPALERHRGRTPSGGRTA